MRTPRPNAFTLIETVLSLGIVGVIAVSMTSIMMLTSRAMPSVRDADVVNVSTREVASRIAAELADATSITGLSAHSVTFTVPDRDSDGLDETFRYGWGGTAGDPLVWTYNGGSAITVASNVQDFTLFAESGTVTQAVAGPSAWGSEVILHEQLAPPTTAMTISGLNRTAHFFKPDFPAGTTGWTVTRASLKIRRASGATAAPVLRVSFVSPGITGTPDLGAFQLTIGDTSGVTSSAQWFTAPFTCATTPTYPSSQGLFLYVAPTTGTNASTAADVGVTAGVANYPSYYCSTNTALLVWSTDYDDGLGCTIWGRFYGPTTTTTTAQRYTRAQVRLRIGSADSTTASAQLLNRPLAP